MRTSRRIDSRFALVVPFRARVSRFSVCSGNTPVQQARFWGIIPYPGSLSPAWEKTNLVYPRDLGLRTLSNKEDCKTFDKWHLKGQERLTGQFLKCTDWSRFSLRLGETAGRSKKQQKTLQYCFCPWLTLPLRNTPLAHCQPVGQHTTEYCWGSLATSTTLIILACSSTARDTDGVYHLCYTIKPSHPSLFYWSEKSSLWLTIDSEWKTETFRTGWLTSSPIDTGWYSQIR